MNPTDTDTDDTATYTTADGALTFEHPAAWEAFETETAVAVLWGLLEIAGAIVARSRR